MAANFIDCDEVLRRTVLKAGAVGVGTLALGAPVAATDDEENTDDEHERDDAKAEDGEHGRDDAKAEGDELTRQLLEVRAATRPYWRDVASARADGYDGVVSPYTPGMGFHFVNPGLVAADENAAFSLPKPSILVYVPTDGYEPGPGDQHDPGRDDELVLAAVEFAHAGTRGAAVDLFADESAEHPSGVPEADGWQFVEGADLTALHVWVPHWNPAGVFHPTNPAVD